MTRILSPDECETVVTMSDASDYARVMTHQQSIITRLKANPSAVLKDEGVFGDTGYAEFEVPKRLLKFARR